MHPPSALPDYAPQIAAFHTAFAGELRAIVGTLPISPQMRVLDVACGDGFYTGLLADRIISPGSVTGIDASAAYLELARQRLDSFRRCQIEFRQQELASLQESNDQFDFIWCAQSLYSLPEPVSALRQMALVLRPGGIVAVLENDTIHQILLPWPSHIEIAVRAIELAAFTDESSQPHKFYVGRQLPQILAAAGLEPLFYRTQCIDRRAPLDPALESFLAHYLQRLEKRVASRLESSLAAEFAALIDAAGDNYLLRQPHFTMSWLNVLAWGRKPT